VSLRLVLLGYGEISERVHGPLLRRRQDVQVVAVADANAERRELARAHWPLAALVSDWREALAFEADAAVVALPPREHADAACAALNATRHLYLEKPLATSVQDGQRVLAAATASARVAMLGFNYRFGPAEQARDWIAQGRLGRIVAIRSVFASPRRAVGWRASREAGGGALQDLGCHHLDLVRFLTGDEAADVRATLWSRASEDDSAILDLRLSGGARVSSFFAHGLPSQDRIEIVGETARLLLDRRWPAPRVRGAEASGLLGELRDDLRGLLSPAHVRKLLAPRHEPSYALAIGAFFAAVSGQRAAADLPGVEDGLETLQIVERAGRQAREP